MHRILNELEKETAKAAGTFVEKTNFIDTLHDWVEFKKFELRTNSYELYTLNLNTHIIPFFKKKNKLITEITLKDIEDYYKTKLKEGLSVETIKKHNVIIRGTLEKAMNEGTIQFNPCDRVRIPRQNRQDRFKGQAYTAEQASKLLEVIHGEVLEPVIMLGLLFGMRRSEALGLRWSDINFRNQTIVISNTMTQMRTLLIDEHTKSFTSHRMLSVMDEVIGYFKRLKAQQEANKREYGDKYHDSDFVCVWPDGRIILPGYVSHNFKKLLAKYDLPEIRFHDLRHTAGSLLLAQGVNIKQIQEFLGHSDVTTTLNIYTHTDENAKKETAAAMGKVLNLH
ncbi:site-specific integrase [Agathobaculum butyriciproducens]|uniref:Site-specific integrase n=1 Tax=Agathobaculum butyriciproducens TaxID=1628085 RepID=A0AAW4W0U7_9FIRM|nr:site-specific integrase [Agathobaculum butyriciproducens]